MTSITDVKGQREKIVYGNGVVTEYSYDPLTYRLKRLKTTRTSDSELLQDLRYTYDPVGNIVEIADLAQEELYHNSELVEPVWKYEYDAIYRLIEATGREHSGQNADIQQDASGFPLVSAANPNDPQAMRNYVESFEYDAVGNILKMIHAAQGSTGSWTRRYDIAEMSNRLLGTSLPGDDETEFSATYTYDEHGSMTTMPHLDGIEWDFKDQKREVDKGGGGTVYFTYDAGGQRVRKVWEHSGIVEERIYLGGFEVYRRHELGNVVLERETLHVMDDARRIAMVETKTVDASDPDLVVASRVRYQLGNHLGSAALELDQAGLVISYEEYHPYGTSAYHAVANGVEVSAKRYRYTGKERDEETGLYYHGARYYAPWLGRWTSADPAGLVDGPNLYRYSQDNPILFSDPSGMVPTVAELEKTVNAAESELYILKGRAESLTELIAKQEVTVHRLETHMSASSRSWWERMNPFSEDNRAISDPKKQLARFVKEARAINERIVVLEGELIRHQIDLSRAREVAGVVNGEMDPLSFEESMAARARAKSVESSGNTRNKGLATESALEGNPRQGVSAVEEPFNPQGGQKGAVVEPSAAEPSAPVVGEAPLSAKGILRSATETGKTGLKAFAPMIVVGGFQYFAQRNYDDAARQRDGYVGTPTSDQIKRQRDAGWEFSGKLDGGGKPVWDYKPGYDLRLRDMLLFLFNPFDPIRRSGRPAPAPTRIEA
ncbi:RHS repeat domain-containing protein [Polyangium fumosum]|uniref:RHS repeat domain-containing protein n=1 Tax=Polyangium fumosum TaxID=889272 RepID=UPI001E5786A7|nr:RHS repeat-associated core domain-containing protein [Polyangium fumosum]